VNKTVGLPLAGGAAKRNSTVESPDEALQNPRPKSGRSAGPDAGGGRIGTGTPYTEVTDNHLGADVFSSPEGAVPTGESAQILFGTTVTVKCPAPNGSGAA
jgi:hypothetical protein